jgi:ribosome-binding factor A
MPERRYPRTARLNEVLREVLAEELERLSDADFGFVTVTGVEVAADLRQATVYYSVFGPKDRRGATADALKAVTGQLKVAIGRQVRMKYTPDLVFKEDPAVAQADRVESIIRELRSKGDLP